MSKKQTLNEETYDTESKVSSATGSNTRGQTTTRGKALVDENGPNPFLDPTVADHYSKVYENCQYECRKRFDPHFHWSQSEEKKLTRKLDWYVTLFACFLFVALQLDRGNIGQAVSDDMLTDLGMITNDLNTGNTIFYLCFLGAELPSQLISKRLGCDVWVPLQMTLWSVVAILQCRLSGKTSFWITRALLGLLEGGFIPDLVLWLSYFYTSAELSIRLSYFWFTLSFTQIISSFIAYGVFHAHSTLHGWQLLFMIEGIFSFLIGFSGFFLMAPSAVQTKRIWAKHGWLTEHEEKIVVNKILRDDPTKGDMNNREGLSLKMIWKSLNDYYLYPVYILGLVAFIPIDTLDSYMTLLLKSMGYSTFDTNLLMIPYYFTQGCSLVITTWISEHYKRIFAVVLLQPLVGAPLVGVLRWWKGSLINPWPTYAILIMILAEPYCHAILVSACSRNSQSLRTRTVSSSVYNMFVQAGSIVGVNIYRTPDSPYYHRGNSALFALELLMFPLAGFAWWFYKHINNKRDKVWKGMSPEEREEYIQTTKDEGSSRLNFRFAY